MGVVANDRFLKTDLKVLIGKHGFPEPHNYFPFEGKTMTCMGLSNKNDLVLSYSDQEVLRSAAVHGHEPRQYIYTDQQAVLYDVCIFLNERMEGVMHAIRTRQAPEKPRKKKERQDNGDIQGDEA
jgi:hypothetical protein